MGLRSASVRHPDALVMAPALTETGEPHKFDKLREKHNSDNRLSFKKLKVFKKNCSVSLGHAKPRWPDRVRSGIRPATNGSSPSKTIHSINGLIKSHAGGFLSLNSTINNSAATADINIENNVRTTRENGTDNPHVTDYALVPAGGCTMDDSKHPLGEENSGLQKDGRGVSSLPGNRSVSPPKEKITQGEVDQLFKNLGVDIPDEMTTPGDLGHNVDDIFRVFHNMESNTGSDIPALGSTPSDGDGIFPSGLSSLFSDDVMMNMCVDENLVNMNKETIIKEKLDEALKKQFQLKRKCDFLMRRLRKLQSRTLGKHVCEEVTGILEYTSNLFDAFNRSKALGSSDPSTDIECQVKSVTLPTLSLLMRQMEHSSAQQASYIAKNCNKQKYFGAGPSMSCVTTNGMRIPGTIIPTFKPEVKREIRKVTGELSSQLSMLESEIDSDLTASSSGCDSCDDSLCYSNVHQQQLPLRKRAVWKWNVERATLASRWTWLQAKMADLEYKIRQTNEMRRQLRQAKGFIRLAAKQASTHLDVPSSPSQPPNGLVDESVVGCARTSGVSGWRKRKLVRVEGLHLVSKRALRQSSVKCCCRGDRPPCLICTGRVDPTSPSHTIDMQPISQRLAYFDMAYHPQLSFPSDVSQSCHYNALMKHSEWQLRAGRVVSGRGRLPRHATDPCVIGPNAAREAVNAVQVGTGGPSTNSTVSRLPHIDASIEPKRCKVLTPSMAGPGPSPHLSDLPTITASLPLIGFMKKNPRGRRKKVPFDGFARIKTVKKHIPIVVSEVESVGSGSSSRGGTNCPGNGSSSGTIGGGLVDADGSCSTVSSVFNGTDPSKYISPIPSPTPSKDLFRRKRENSYDIDNIVIPYCMAASTRPEKLHYKEILTPKWRLVKDEVTQIDVSDLKNGVRRGSHDYEGEEDASDECVIARHDRCEVEERKRFLSYLKIGRSRGGRRVDSRAESSGPNTPDQALSPVEQDPPSPAPPMPVPMEQPQSAPPPPQHAPPPPPPPPPPPLTTTTSVSTLQPPLTRKRTISLGSQPKSPTNSTPEVAPYEPRVFPLTDEDYESMVREQKDFQEYPVDESLILRNCESGASESVSNTRESGPGSPSTDSVDSLQNTEDPNDPEWTSSKSRQ